MTKATSEVCASFAVPAEAYDRLMGRYLPRLGPAFASAAGVRAGMTALDVGCGPGGLTRELVARLGADSVAAIDPSAPFVQACRARNPGVDARVGRAEQLPFADASFDVTLASLVVGFMSDAEAGIREMARVSKPGGTVAACFWDLHRMPALTTFWEAATQLNPAPGGEMRRRGGAAGELAALLRETGLTDVKESTLTASADYADFADWWEPFTLGVGPAGQYHASLTPADRQALRDRANELLGNPSGPFTLTAHAWCATAHRPQPPRPGWPATARSPRSESATFAPPD